MLIWISATCLVILFFYTILYLWNHRGTKDLPPGPYGLPLVGYLPFINATKPYETFSSLARKYGSIYGLRMGQVYAVVLSDPGVIRKVLAKEESTGRAPLFITHGIMGGHGIICAQGELWRDQRRLTIEWLRRLGMVKYGPGRANLEQKICLGLNTLRKDIWASAKDGNSFDPSADIHHALGNLMNDLVFGLQYEKKDATWQFLQHLQEEGVKHIGVSMAVNFLPFLRFLPSTRRIISFLLDGKAKTHLIYDEIIENERKTLAASTVANMENGCILRSFLKEASERQKAGRCDALHCTDTQLRHLMADLFGAGIDTTFTTIRWALLYVTLHPKVQHRLREEIKQTVAMNEAPTLDDIELLPYLRATIAEVQRIRTVVPIGIPHGITKDITIDGFRIPANTMILPLLWTVHMDPVAFPEPDTFKPERFLDEEGKFIMPGSFLPFQCGKRMCLGDELARCILHLYMANLLFCCDWFDIDEEDARSIDITGNCGITLSPPAYRMVFSKIKH